MPKPTYAVHLYCRRVVPAHCIAYVVQRSRKGKWGHCPEQHAVLWGHWFTELHRKEVGKWDFARKPAAVHGCWSDLRWFEYSPITRTSTNKNKNDQIKNKKIIKRKYTQEIKIKITPYQKWALVRLAYNCAVESSTAPSTRQWMPVLSDEESKPVA